MHMKTSLAAFGLASIFLASPAAAQHAAKHDAASKAKEADEAPPDGAASQAAIDPSTGRLRALTREEARALAEAAAASLSQSSEGLRSTVLPGGAIAVDLDGRFESVSLARARTDGTVDARCVTTAEEARQYLGADATPGKAAGLEEK